MRNRLHVTLIACALVAWPTCQAQSTSAVEPRIIELTADKDSRYRHGGKIAPTIEVFAGESLILRITAVRAMEVARDGSRGPDRVRRRKIWESRYCVPLRRATSPPLAANPFPIQLLPPTVFR